ncbi:MAG: sigma-54 dependent transcriptional regulator [Bermanella sp.]
MKPTLVLVDDEVNILESLKRCLRSVDANIECFSSPIEALQFCQDNKPILVISDQRMPLLQGSELFAEIKQFDKNCQCFLLSAYHDFDDITLAFNQGVIDRYIAKPWDIKEIRYHVSQVLSQEESVSKSSNQNQFHNIIAQSKKMFEVFDYVRRAANSNVPIFIHGETGTGKELIAKACHAESYRNDHPFIAVNCANFSEHLMESQLFGHKKGSFTGAVGDQGGMFHAAEGGTLFLDEVTTIPLALQSKLLRVIQEREYSPVGSHKAEKFNAQIITASSQTLSEAVEKGEFREDLFYRLNVIYIHLPPLRERENDIELISDYYLKKYSKEVDKQFDDFSIDARELMHEYRWPGNIRQLENLIHSLVILNDGPQITGKILGGGLQENFSNAAPMMVNEKPALVQNIKDEFEQERIESPREATLANPMEIKPLWLMEKEFIENAISQCAGNITKAAVLLEISPSTIYRKQQSWKK